MKLSVLFAIIRVYLQDAINLLRGKSKAHTRQCRAARRREHIALIKFAAKYPGYCHHCGATGSVQWHENAAPFGSGEYWAMPCEDFCEHCIEQGKCPRCGSERNNFYDADPQVYRCLACNWGEGETGCPETEK